MTSTRAAVRELVAALARAQQAFDAGNLDDAREAVDRVLATDPHNAAAHALKERLAEPVAAAAAPAPAAPPPSGGTGWVAFEQRVRARRAEKLVARIEAAHAAGNAAAARDALAELRELDPEHSALERFEAEVAAGSPVEAAALQLAGESRAETPSPLDAFSSELPLLQVHAAPEGESIDADLKAALTVDAARDARAPLVDAGEQTSTSEPALDVSGPSPQAPAVSAGADTALTEHRPTADAVPDTVTVQGVEGDVEDASPALWPGAPLEPAAAIPIARAEELLTHIEEATAPIESAAPLAATADRVDAPGSAVASATGSPETLYEGPVPVTFRPAPLAVPAPPPAADVDRLQPTHPPDEPLAGAHDGEPALIDYRTHEPEAPLIREPLLGASADTLRKPRPTRARRALLIGAGVAQLAAAVAVVWFLKGGWTPSRAVAEHAAAQPAPPAERTLPSRAQSTPPATTAAESGAPEAAPPPGQEQESARATATAGTADDPASTIHVPGASVDREPPARPPSQEPASAPVTEPAAGSARPPSQQTASEQASAAPPTTAPVQTGRPLDADVAVAPIGLPPVGSREPALSADASAAGVGPLPSLPAAAPPAAAPATAVPPPDRDAGVRAAVNSYRLAYNKLDASAAQRIWPSVDGRALQRAFNQLRAQTLTFDRCQLRTQTETAAVTCEGEARWVPGIGDRSPRTERRTWNFSLVQSGSEWHIVEVNVSH